MKFYRFSKNWKQWIIIHFVPYRQTPSLAPNKEASEVNLKFNEYVSAKDIENRRQKLHDKYGVA